MTYTQFRILKSALGLLAAAKGAIQYDPDKVGELLSAAVADIALCVRTEMNIEPKGSAEAYRLWADARHPVLDTAHNRVIFEKGYEAGQAQTPDNVSEPEPKPEPTDAQLDDLLADWCDVETLYRGDDGTPFDKWSISKDRARHMLRRVLSEFSAPNLEPVAPNRFEVPAWNAYLALDSLVGPKPSTNFRRFQGMDIFGRVKGTWAASAEARCREAYAELGLIFAEARQSSADSSENDSKE